MSQNLRSCRTSRRPSWDTMHAKARPCGDFVPDRSPIETEMAKTGKHILMTIFLDDLPRRRSGGVDNASLIARHE